MPAYEPTDKELNDLMKSVIEKVKIRAKNAKNKFNNDLFEAFKKVK